MDLNIDPVLEALRRVASPQDFDQLGFGQFAVRKADDVVQSLEEFQERPNRPRANPTLTSLEDFIAYVGRFSTKDTIVFAKPADLKMVALIDYHERSDDAGLIGDPSHIAHQAVYQAKWASGYEAWRGLHKRSIAQKELGEFLEDHAKTIVTPSAADVMQMVMQFSVERKVTFKAGQSLANGTQQLTYLEEDGQARGAITFHEAITIRTPILDGGPEREVLVRLRYRMNDGRLSFIPVLPERDRIEEDAFGSAVAEFRGAFADKPIAPPVYVGAFAYR